MITLAALRTELLFVRAPRACVGVAARGWPAVEAELRRRRPDACLLVGFAGGLRAELLPGTLILASQVLDGAIVRPADGLLERARTALPQARVGPVHTVEAAAGPGEKARLGLDALAVDMESAQLARGLEELKLPWLAVRVVLDALWEELPRGAARAGWVARTLGCALRLGEASRRLAPVLVGGSA